MNIFVCITLNSQQREFLISLSDDVHFFFHDELSENVPPHSDFLESLICYGNVRRQLLLNILRVELKTKFSKKFPGLRIISITS